jgi:DNA-binding beta-propeller fold protein YncE
MSARVTALLAVAGLLATASATGALPVAAQRTAPAVVEVVLASQLARPTALAFNPHDGTLWIVNAGGRLDTTTIVADPDAAAATASAYRDTTAHYLANPNAIAFSPTLNEVATAADFGGGPTLWTADRNVFRGSVESHLDMVHYTEPAVGIAPGADSARREYWVINAKARSLDRYFFNKPHELGGTDHSDGVVYRYVPGSLRPGGFGVPSHAAFDPATRILYVADTGNSRIVRFRAGRIPSRARVLNGGKDAGGMRGHERLFASSGGKVVTLVRKLRRPSGLLLKDRHLIVGEYATGLIHVFTLQGRRRATLDTGLGKNALTGIASGPDGRIYMLDARRSRLLRLVAPASLP